MRIHTDTLTADDLTDAAKLARCTVESVAHHRSTARDHAFEFIISGHGTHGGAYGRLPYAAGSWDDYGIMLAELFRRDPRAIVGTPGRPTYDGAADFHARTVDRYRTLTPEQAHHNHRRDHTARDYVTVQGFRLSPCKGSKGRPCTAYI
jgi:hypothetical protein